MQGCGKADFVTLHGFMCHLTKKHKDRTLGSQSRALEVCGVVFDPNAPLPPVTRPNRASTEGSPLESAPLDADADAQEGELDSESEDGDRVREDSLRVKTEATDRPMPDADDSSVTPAPPATLTPPKPVVNGSTKQSISSIIDRSPEPDSREALASLPSSESLALGPLPPPPAPSTSSVPSKRKYEYSPPAAEKENTEPREGSPR